MASESWSSSTTAWIVLLTASLNTRATLAGASASLAKRSGSDDQGTMSMRSPPSSFTTACTREPLRPTHAPTGSMRIVAREDGDLRAAADFAGGRPDLDDVLLDLRDLELEQRLDEQRVGAAQDEARTLGRLLDALEHGADRLALMEVLAMVLLAIRNDRFRLAELVEHDDELAALDLLDFAGQQVADAGRELVADLGALAFADALDDALLGGLDGGAAEHGEVERLLHHVAELEALVEQAGLLERRSRARDPRRLDDRLEDGDLDLALGLVDVDFGLDGGPCFFASAAMKPSCSSP